MPVENRLLLFARDLSVCCVCVCVCGSQQMAK